tara:strand:- start:70090 stop:70515 length:426 start_codon:yes stop_codon:yes gene_type:complete
MAALAPFEKPVIDHNGPSDSRFLTLTGNATLMSLYVFGYTNYMALADGGKEVRIGFAFALTMAILYLSIRKILSEGAITSDVWALLLGVPLTIFIVMSFGMSSVFEPDVDVLEDSWDGSVADRGEGGVGDPEESGFDIPVL